jgi:hypothetical protein
MEVPVSPAQSEAMKTSFLIAGILAAGMTAQARDSKPADVTVYVKGDSKAPSSVDQGARATVTWMFARVGVRLAWRNGEPGTGTLVASPVTIQIRFTKEAPAGVSPEALARALPFRGQSVAIDIMYDRIRFVAHRSNREAPLLAHVLAHEIGHVLQGTNGHAPGGVMKARWNGPDYDAMERKPLEFTSLDLELIKDRLNLLRTRAAAASPEAIR